MCVCVEREREREREREIERESEGEREDCRLYILATVQSTYPYDALVVPYFPARCIGGVCGAMRCAGMATWKQRRSESDYPLHSLSLAVSPMCHPLSTVRTALLKAARAGDFPFVRMLLEDRDADVNVADKVRTHTRTHLCLCLFNVADKVRTHTSTHLCLCLLPAYVHAHKQCGSGGTFALLLEVILADSVIMFFTVSFRGLCSCVWCGVGWGLYCDA